MRKTKTIMFGCAAWLLAWACSAATETNAVETAAGWERLDYLNRNLIHRGGGRDTRPDNALETFLWCWGHGVAPEADVRQTKDGYLIALHDDTLIRVGRGIPGELARCSVSGLQWKDIRDVDVGSYLSSQFASTRSVA